MQRGVGNVNPMKMPKQDNLTLPTQSDIAEELEISKQQLQDYKKLTTLIPELQQMVENDSMKANSAWIEKWKEYVYM